MVLVIGQFRMLGHFQDFNDNQALSLHVQHGKFQPQKALNSPPQCVQSCLLRGIDEGPSDLGQRQQATLDEDMGHHSRSRLRKQNVRYLHHPSPCASASYQPSSPLLRFTILLRDLRAAW
jgi:hypothetical protein